MTDINVCFPLNSFCSFLCENFLFSLAVNEEFIDECFSKKFILNPVSPFNNNNLQI